MFTLWEWLHLWQVWVLLEWERQVSIYTRCSIRLKRFSLDKCYSDRTKFVFFIMPLEFPTHSICMTHANVFCWRIFDATEPSNSGLINNCGYLLMAKHKAAHDLVWVFCTCSGCGSCQNHTLVAFSFIIVWFTIRVGLIFQNQLDIKPNSGLDQKYSSTTIHQENCDTPCFNFSQQPFNLIFWLLKFNVKTIN